MTLGADTGAFVRPLAPEVNFSLSATQGGVVVLPQLSGAFFSRNSSMAIAVPTNWGPYFANISDACGSNTTGIAMASLPWMNATEAMSAVEVSAESDAAFPEGAMRQLEGCFGINGSGYGAVMIVSNVTRDIAPQQEFAVTAVSRVDGTTSSSGFLSFSGLTWVASVAGAGNNPSVRIAVCINSGTQSFVASSLGTNFLDVTSDQVPSGIPSGCDKFIIGPPTGSRTFGTITDQLKASTRTHFESGAGLGARQNSYCIAWLPGKRDDVAWELCAQPRRVG